LIAFVGSVFSPYYALARRRGHANPYHHCAFNVALYGKQAQRWTMTERGHQSLRRSASVLSIGPSHMRWTGNALEMQVDEICAPVPRRVRGKIRLFPDALGDRSFMLDSKGRHRWTPYAPCSRVEVVLSHPDLRWSGNGYFDANFGTAPLEADFQEWTWSRASGPHGTTVLYDVTERDASHHSLALRFSDAGRVESIEPPARVELPKSKWGVARHTRADPGCAPRIIQTLEDAPFYNRTLLDASVSGAQVPAIHESLDLNRFNSRWVQCLLPFRMPRMAL
jgi:carotenoid 1,2-hydratase